MRAAFFLVLALLTGGCAVSIFAATYPDPPKLPPRICTPSLGVPDCWTNPQVLGEVRPLADNPFHSTAAQTGYRAGLWP